MDARMAFTRKIELSSTGIEKTMGGEGLEKIRRVNILDMLN